jgi:hypothetical protein
MSSGFTYVLEKLKYLFGTSGTSMLTPKLGAYND